MKKIFDVIGLMSGSSLDGLDIAYCEIRQINSKWEADIFCAETVPYNQIWTELLRDAVNADGHALSLLNTSYGHWIGQTVNNFIRKNDIRPKLIASHGHTVFHNPAEKMTLQIGCGAAIAAETGITTVSDFRSLNVALGGHGAPLVPVGDKLLFGAYNACVNIGGFANISREEGNKRIGYDICPANTLLNDYANKLGYPFDPSGTIARSGLFNVHLFQALEDLPFYSKTGPRSLSREWINSQILPILREFEGNHRDTLATLTRHVASQISANLPQSNSGRVLITGGGAKNTFLIELIKKQVPCEIVIPDEKIIDFKEALVFALLGVLRMEGINNCLAEVTGAKTDCCSGAIHFPPHRTRLNI